MFLSFNFSNLPMLADKKRSSIINISESVQVFSYIFCKVYGARDVFNAMLSLV